MFTVLFLKRLAICFTVTSALLYAFLTYRFYDSTNQAARVNEKHCRTVLNNIAEILERHSYEEAEGTAAYYLALLSEGWDVSANGELPGVYSVQKGRSYGCLIDSVTGEILVDSGRKGFLAIRQEDPEKEGENFTFLLCPFEDVAEIYERVDARNTRSFEEVFLTGGTYYTEELLDVYVKGSCFKPGRVQIDEVIFDPAKGGEPTLVGREVLDLSFNSLRENGPENQESGYAYWELDPEELHPFLIMGGGEQKDGERDRAEIQFRRLEQNGGGFLSERENSGIFAFYSGTVWYAVSRCFTDRTGREYILNFYCEYPTLFQDNLSTIRKIAAAFWLLALSVALAWTGRVYWALKNRNAKDEYRRALMDSMAHDLKSPLMAIGGYAENLKQNTHVEKRDHYIDGILDSVYYMQDIIGKDLELSRLERDEYPVRRTKLEGVGICRELFSRWQSETLEKRLSVSFKGSFVFKGDRELFERAIDNLVTNCIRYTPGDGKIEVVGNGYSLRIRNDAQMEYRGRINRLWEPFVVGDASRSGRKGTGLGLSIAHSIFRRHALLHYLRYDKNIGVFECILIKRLF